jgi:hypothetical protein
MLLRTPTNTLPLIVFAVGGVITLALFSTYFYMAGGVGIYSDGIGYYAPLRSLVFDGNLDVSNEYQYFAVSVSRLSGEVRWPFPIPQYSKYTIGMAVVLSPFFFAGHIFTLLLQRLGVPIAANGLSWPYEFFYGTGSAVLGICGMYLSYRAAKTRFGSFSAVVATVGVWFASSIFYYLAIVPSMSHAVSQFLVSAFLYLTLTRDWLAEKRTGLLMGFILGLATLVRPQDVFFIVVPLCLALLKWKGDSKVVLKDLAALCRIGCIVALIAMFQVLVYKIQFEELSRIPYLIEGATDQRVTSFDWAHPQVASVLFSGFHGLFSWHPILLVSILGAVWSIRTHRQFIALLLAFFLQVYLISSWYNWWQGASFGGRMFSNCNFIFVMGLASLWSRARIPLVRQVAVLLTSGCIVWNILLVMQYVSRMIPAEEPLLMKQIIMNQFNVLPFFLARFIGRPSC